MSQFDSFDFACKRCAWQGKGNIATDCHPLSLTVCILTEVKIHPLFHYSVMSYVHIFCIICVLRVS